MKLITTQSDRAGESLEDFPFLEDADAESSDFAELVSSRSPFANRTGRTREMGKVGILLFACAALVCVPQLHSPDGFFWQGAACASLAQFAARALHIGLVTRGNGHGK